VVKEMKEKFLVTKTSLLF